MKLSLKSPSHIIDLLFTLALFCVFVACSLTVVIIGANVYKETVKRMNENYDMRTSLTYLSQKVRQNDIADGIYLSTLDGKSALVLEQAINGEKYQTWIYHDDGSLKELTSKVGNDISLSDGQAIMSAADFLFEQEKDGLFTFTHIDKEGNSTSTKVMTRCD